MHWRRWIYISIAELVSAGIAAVVGVFTNILTNEKHPERAVIFAIIVLAVSSGILQVVIRAIESRQSRSVDTSLRGVEETTREIRIHQIAQDRDRAEQRLDERLTHLPAIFRAWIKEQWAQDSGGIDRVLDALSEPSTDPTGVVIEWQQRMPIWLRDLGWRSLLVAAELANAYGAGQLSINLLLAAIEAGSTREQYWRAKAALLMKYRGETQAARQTLADGQIDSHSGDQLARIVYYFVVNNRRMAQAQLDEWDPPTPIDILLASGVRVSLIMADVDDTTVPTAIQYSQAAAVYRNTIQEIPESATARLNLANMLINLVAAHASINRHQDLQEALEQAIAARDICRQTRASSVQAVEFACQAAYFDMKFTRVIEIGTVVTGEATPEEARSDVVKSLVYAAALAKGDTDISSRLISEISDSFRKAYLLAVSSEVGGAPSESLWTSALDQARDAKERAQALLGLARMGASDLPGLDDPHSITPRDAAVIRAVEGAASGNVSSAIQQLRALPGPDFDSVGALVDAYVQVGNLTAATEVLREAAHVLNEPRLRIEAARLLRQSDKQDDARAELESLLVDAASDTAIRHDCLALLGQWAAEQQDWPTAQARFLELLALDASDTKARWAVILVLLHRGLVSDARRVYESAPVEPAITTRDEARAWMAIRADFHDVEIDVARLVEQVMDLAQRFSDDENVQAEAIATILSSGNAKQGPLPASIQVRFNQLCERFFDTWPDSTMLRRVSANDAEALLSQMEDLVRPSQEEKILRNDVADKLAQNTLPWAFLSAMVGRSYSEVVIVRAGGVLPARHIDMVEQQLCWEAVQSSIDKEIVLDISAAAVLIALPDLTDLLIGQFERLIVSEGERLDAGQASRFLGRRGTSYWTYDAQNDRGRLVDISEELANQRHDNAIQLVALIDRCRVSNVTADPRFAELGNLATSSWATAVQCAAQSGTAFWCDDVALRALARSIGVAAFSTPSLLEVLLDRQVLTADQHESAVRALIVGLVGDFPLDLPRLSDLTVTNHGVAGPVASIFSRSAAWIDANRAYQIWTALLEQAVAIEVKYASDWLYPAVIGIARLQASAFGRKEAAALLLSRAISMVGDSPNEIARCVIAARTGVAAVRRDSGEDDPLSRAVQIILENRARVVGRQNATVYVSGLFNRLEGEDRLKVLQVLYV